MKILSLFDGMACGALAMQAAGIEIDKYIAYEVDKYAIQTAQHNFPFIEERGDVFKADFTEYAGFDYLIGGSPCTYWSIAQTKNRETVASGMGWELFSQYVRALHEAKPRFFLYENNKSMSAAIRASITETFGFEPILINSALVSAQNRQRLYWCGIRQADGTYKKADIQQPADRGILLKDILETGVTWREKSHTIDVTYYKGGSLNGEKPHQNSTRLMAAEPVAQRGRYDDIELVNYKERKDSKIVITDRNMRCVRNDLKHSSATESVVMLPNAKSNALITAHGVKVFEKIAEPVCVAQRGRYDESGKVTQHYEAQPTGKTNNLTTVSKDNLIAEPINAMKYELESVENKDAGVVAVLDMAGQEQIKRVYGTNGKCATLTTCQGGHREPKVFEKIAEPVNITKDGKAGTLRATYYKDGVRNLIANSIDKKTCVAMRVNEATKVVPIYEVKDGFITVKGKKYPIKLVDGFYIIRKLTVRECMRLQTVPEWYEWPVSKSQAYKMLGNGWTVEVIAHLLRGLK